MAADSQIDIDALAGLHGRLQQEGSPPGLLLLTNPHNPLGIVEIRDQLGAILDWVLANTAMDVVVDEIYAHSLFGQTPFTSVLGMPQSLLNPERVHSVWGFAKDFGLSGWMTGVLFTRSTRLVKSISSGYARFSPFDKLKSRIIRRLLLEGGSKRSPQALMDVYGQRLRKLHREVTGILGTHHIPYRETAEGALFIWLDLRAWLDVDLAALPGMTAVDLDAGNTPAMDIREHRLQRFIAHNARVSLVRGQVLYSDEPGYLRLCFTAAQPDAVLAGVERLSTCLGQARP
jgi:aspartate/methionine/tyrosine aminotransferase